MTNDKVCCPWCGSEMKLEHLGSDDCEAFLYACHECGASSPMKSSNDEALQAALARPLQKPLTLEEARKNPTVIYFEHKSLSKLNGYGVRIMCESRYQMQDGSIMPMLSKHVTNNSFYIGEFGIDWRCWATKPTDEEREAAKWDE